MWGWVCWDGRGKCHGRIDHQCNSRGVRIEWAEVATALARQHRIGAAVALVRQLNGSEEIVAFCVPMESGLATGELRETLRQELPTAVPE